MKAYIASGLKNYKRVLALRDRLAERGVELSYDWAASVEHNAKYGKKESKENWLDIAKAEVRGISDAKVVLFLVPAGRGAHFELGMAYAWGVPVVILEDEAQDEIAFYELSWLERFQNEDEALERVVEHASSDIEWHTPELCGGQHALYSADSA